jgi:hypothetical protein
MALMTKWVVKSLVRFALVCAAGLAALFGSACNPSAEELKQKELKEISSVHEKSKQLFEPYFEEFLRPYRQYSDREGKLLNDRSTKSLAELAKMQEGFDKPYVTGKLIFIRIDGAGYGTDYKPDYDEHNDDARLNEQALIARSLEEVGTVVYVHRARYDGPPIQTENGTPAGHLSSIDYDLYFIDRKNLKVVGNKTFQGEMPEGNPDSTFTKTVGKAPDIVPYILALPRR